jgi:hypothetical protein
MTALNLAFRNLYGFVIHGNSLALEQKLVYRTGFDGLGVIREIPLAACPLPVQQQVTAQPENEPVDERTAEVSADDPHTLKHQLRLF